MPAGVERSIRVTNTEAPFFQTTVTFSPSPAANHAPGATMPVTTVYGPAWPVPGETRAAMRSAPPAAGHMYTAWLEPSTRRACWSTTYEAVAS